MGGAVKFKVFAPIIIFLVIFSGCIYKPPYVINISLNKPLLEAGETFYITMVFNNTGKVAFVKMEDLSEIPDNFIIVQSPQFPKTLKVGESARLVWVFRAPSTPGTYPLKLRFRFIDELNRPWFEHKEFLVTVIEKKNKGGQGKLVMTFNLSSNKVNGGEEVTGFLNLTNLGDAPVKITSVLINPPRGATIISREEAPSAISPKDAEILNFTLKMGYSYFKGYVTVFVGYVENGQYRTDVLSSPIEVLWMPWKVDRETLKEVYGGNYYWIVNPYVVDGYWKEKYNAEIIGDIDSLREYTKGLTEGAISEVDAARNVFNWIKKNYSFGDTTTAVDPILIAQQRKISYDEGQILFVGMMRALNIPSRLVTLYDGSDCTLNAVSEFYSGGKWYVVDFKRDFFGSRAEYMSTPYFPRIYYLFAKGGYKLVAQAPEEVRGHEHVNVGAEYLSEMQDGILGVLKTRTTAYGKIKLDKIISTMQGDERIFALFLLASAPRNELNELLEGADIGEIEKNIKTIYEFYKDVPYPEDFRVYWKVLKEGTK